MNEDRIEMLQTMLLEYGINKNLGGYYNVDIVTKNSTVPPDTIDLTFEEIKEDGDS